MKKLNLTLLLLFTYAAIIAQSYTISLPSANKEACVSDTLIINNKSATNNFLQSKSKAEAFRFGETLEITKDDLLKGKWTYLGNDKYVWKIIIKKEYTSALNAYFSNVNIKENDKIFVYSLNPGNKILLIDSSCQISKFGTSLFYGNSLVIEYYSNEQKKLPFTINEIGYSLNKKKTNRDFGEAGDCEISVNCSEGEPYKLQKNSVSRILVKQGSGLFWCTGSLINNTKQDGKPFLITANHCGNTSTLEDYSDWVFDFNFESPDCDRPVFEPEKNTIYGSQLLAHTPHDVNSYSDFKLLLLNENIPSGFKPYYIGWDRSNAGSSKGACIHQPQGDIKMISSYLQPLTSTEYHNDIDFSNGKYWRVNWSETESGQGVTEGGSSGSPIYNQQGLLIGTLTGGDASCEYPNDPDWFGKFSYHWESNGDDSTNQLKYWLDPLNSETEFLNGTNLDFTNVIAAFSSNTQNINIGGAVEFINLSQGKINNYEWHFQGGEPETSNMMNPELIKYLSAGEFDVKLRVKSLDGSDSLIASKFIKVRSKVYPSITRNIVNIGVGSMPSEKITFNVINSIGQNVIEIKNPTVNSSGFVVLDLSSLMSGPYVISFSLDGFWQRHTIILAK
jgi:hypothetical protein